MDPKLLKRLLARDEDQFLEFKSTYWSGHSGAEIGAMKLAAIIGRGTRKDLVDLYFILQQVPIEDLFEVAAVKYARVRTFAVSATRALAYFDDAEALPMPLMLDRTPWATMKQFLEHQAMEVGRQRLGNLWL